MRHSSPQPVSFLSLLFYTVNALLGFRFIFKLFTANASHWLVRSLYDVTDPFVMPFRGIFSGATQSGVTIEWAAIVAMAALAFLMTVITWFVAFIQQQVDEDEELEEALDRIHHRHA